MIDRNVATPSTLSVPKLASSAEHPIDLVTKAQSKPDSHDDAENIEMARSAWRTSDAVPGNEHHRKLALLFESDRRRWRRQIEAGSALLGRSGEGRRSRRQGNDSINLSWSVLNNASTTIGHGHATLPDPAIASSSSSSFSSGGSDVANGGESSEVTNIIINRNNSVASETSSSSGTNRNDSHIGDEGVSSKVIEGILRRSNSASHLLASAVAADNEADDGVQDSWDGRSDEKKNDNSNRDNGVAFGKITNDHPRRRSDALSASAEHAKWTDQSGASTSRRHDTKGDREHSTKGDNKRTTTTSSSGQSTASLIESRRRNALQSDSILPLVDATEDSSAASATATRNEISEDATAAATVRNRTEVRRPIDGTATNAKLIAATSHGDKTFAHNNITRETTIISRNETVSSSQPSSMAAAAAAAGVTNGISRNKTSSTHNSIRTLNHISERKPFYGKHHHNNDK